MSLLWGGLLIFFEVEKMSKYDMLFGFPTITACQTLLNICGLGQ